MRNSPPLGPYGRHICLGPYGGPRSGVILMSEVPLYSTERLPWNRGGRFGDSTRLLGRVENGGSTRLHALPFHSLERKEVPPNTRGPELFRARNRLLRRFRSEAGRLNPKPETLNPEP